MTGCSGKFIRRSYLTRHLILCHKLDGVTARRAALVAPRGDDRPSGYYEEVSDDDSVLDILQDLIDANQFEANAALVSFDTTVWDNVQSGDVSVADVLEEDVTDILDDDVYGDVSGDVSGGASGSAVACVTGDGVSNDVMFKDAFDVILGDVAMSDSPGDFSRDSVTMGGDVAEVTRDIPADVSRYSVTMGGDVAEVTRDIPGDVSRDTVTMGGDVSDVTREILGDVSPDSVTMGGDVACDGIPDDDGVASADAVGSDPGDNDVSDVIPDDTRNIVQFHQDELTQMPTFTFKRQIKFINGVKIIKNFDYNVNK